ncbi:MAG: alginate lyase family protein [Planctomycetota bacterium]|nr:alginate lyase family protein [Planctomycetota bacterium]
MLGTGKTQMRDLAVRRQVLGMKLLKPLIPEIVRAQKAEAEGAEDAGYMADTAMISPAYAAAYLYTLDHPENPFRGEAEMSRICFDLFDCLCMKYEASRKAGKMPDTTEWPPYAMAEVMRMLPPGELGEARRRRWAEALAFWCESVAAKPFFFTSPNHEAWKCMAMYSAGLSLDRPDLREEALFQMRQEIAYQTPDGFWEEGRHHGPSLSYNYMQLHPMARVAEMSGDGTIRAAAIRLAGFMADFHFPDGTLMACLDGRQPYGFGPAVVVPGQDITPAMREIARRAAAFKERHGCFSDPRRIASSYWGLAAGMAMPTDGARFFREADEPPVALPMDADGAVVERHSAWMDGGAIRRGGFVTALSGIVSDIPKETRSPFRLLRQNRIDLWHEKTGLILGGGHHDARHNPPFANVVMDTGFCGRTDRGSLDPALWDRQLSYIFPRAARTSFAKGEARLELHFAHGTVSFAISFPSADRAEILYLYRAMGVERLRIQLVPVLFHGSILRVDGENVPAEPSPSPARRVGSSVEVNCAESGGAYRIERVEGRGEMLLLGPFDPMRAYIPLRGDEPFDPLYRQAILSVEVPCGPGRNEGAGSFRVSVS